MDSNMNGLIWPIPRAWAARHPTIIDSLLAVTLCAFAATAYLKAETLPDGRRMTTFDLIVSVVAAGAVAGRRRFPRTLLILVTAGLAAQYTITQNRIPLLIMAGAIVSYTVASRTDRRTTWMHIAGSGFALYLADAIRSRDLFALDSLPVLTFLSMAAAFGDATRSRRAYLAEVEERARRAEQTREEEAQRRVIQERLRIARELHDVVAHHIAVISVQAAAASHLLDKRPEQVRPALDLIRHSGDDVLKELSSIVGVLRQSDDPVVTTEPTPGLSRLPALLDTLRATGLDVRLQSCGTERELPAMADLAAYRITQEALTNAHKYGTGSTALTLTWDNRGLTIEVINPARGDRAAGSGYGIVGMRERAVAAGGTLEAGETGDGRFRLLAVLPFEEKS
ncbi:sensor histidine kinase [Actinoplanes couchii]|uniref:histidine kinase n=1 Tax=Actinoplanes couchii TaxID=403638 RepID=A0ABQ3X7V3_9ACTN|nr:histidine kinase [Actinoplanes couchii]MDR6322321.1 signal transduction histidine kinase [Actinoplanes couchii]GID54480.1 two-component sensor histidine kinase [Actinoplanes couchii]